MDDEVSGDREQRSREPERTAEPADSSSTASERSEWVVGGSVYQVMGDAHFGAAPAADEGGGGGEESAKPVAERWQTWVAVVIGVLTAVTMIIQVVRDLKPEATQVAEPGLEAAPAETASQEQVLAGFVRDEQGEPLVGVEIALPGHGLSVLTDSWGHFQLEVTAPAEETVDLLATKRGYRPFEAYATLGNRSFGFTMRRAP